MTKLDVMGPVMEAAKQVAIDYYRLTGKPLGITGEIGEYYAAKHLGLELAEARTPGFDAYGKKHEPSPNPNQISLHPTE